MANFRTTADYVDAVLLRAGEVTNGNSAYEARALSYVNKIHQKVIGGGNELAVEINEPWIWARSPRPIVIELQPKYETGTVSLTKGSEAGSFSAAVAESRVGWFLEIPGRDGVFRIVTHSAGGTAFELDGLYDGDTGATLSYRIFKLDYDLYPSHLIVDGTNDKIDFEETASSELTATLTHGSYTPSELATEVDTQLTAAGASSYTITYSSTTRKFTLASDRAGGGGTFKLLGATGTNASTSALLTLGFDQADQADAASHTGLYPLGGISRLIEPFGIHKGYYGHGSVYSIDPISMKTEWPLNRAEEGYPEKFSIIKETDDGEITVRFNKYPKEVTRVEIEYIPVPIDLQDNTVSRPLIPRKYSDILEFGAASYLLFEKHNVEQASAFKGLARDQLTAMMKANRAQMSRVAENFGQVVPRQDYVSDLTRRMRKEYGYTAGDY